MGAILNGVEPLAPQLYVLRLAELPRGEEEEKEKKGRCEKGKDAEVKGRTHQKHRRRSASGQACYGD